MVQVITFVIAVVALSAFCCRVDPCKVAECHPVADVGAQ